MPFQMIAKVAEAFALRKGFSDKLKGLSIPEEQAAFEDNQMNVTPSATALEKGKYLEEIEAQIKQYKNTADLLKFYKQNPQWVGDDEVTAIFTKRKEEIENGK